MKHFPNLILDDWQRNILQVLRTRTFEKSTITNVTLLAYFFWDDDRINTKFYTVECAFLCSFQNFGLMPSVLVVNRTTPIIDAFCEKYDVTLQVDPLLTGGVPTMNIDCVEKLHTRFNTNYVLVIQSDGIPIRSGLEEFVGPYDYLGAPWPGHTTYFDWYPYPKYGVGNGGFTLRSRRLCEISASYYRRYFKRLPYFWWLVGDDVFYCKTLRFWFRSVVKNIAYAPIDVAGRFAVEHANRYFPSDCPPLAFHSQIGFTQILHRFGCPMDDLLLSRKDGK